MLEICTDAIICYGWVFEANMDRLSFQKLVNFFNLEIEFDKESKYTNCIDYPQFSNICKQLIIKFDLFQKENKSQIDFIRISLDKITQVKQQSCTGSYQTMLPEIYRKIKTC